jgi:hypothetical protein
MDHDRMSTPRKGERVRSWWVVRWLTLGVRLLRLTAFSTITLAVVLLVSAERARGDVGEKMIALGRELLPLADVLKGAQHATVNGQSIYLASTVTDQSVSQVLDRYETHCREHAGGLAEEYAALPAKTQALLAARAPAAWNERLGIVREQQDGEGMVVCLAQSEQDGIRGLVGRIQLFLKDGELSHLGNLRYAYVRETEAGQSHVLTTFTEGSFNVYRVIGTDSVTPRDELDGVPLPPDALTPMTFRAEGMPYAVQSFASPETPEQVAAYYLAALPRLGWERVLGPGELFANVVMRRNGVTLLLAALQIEEGGKSNVVITEGTATEKP